MSIFFPMIPLKPFLVTPPTVYTLYVGVNNAGPYTCTVAVVDPVTDTVTTQIPITPPGTAFVTMSSTNTIAITPDQTKLFAATSENFGGLVKIDVAANTVDSYFNSTTGFSWTPVGIAIALKGGTGELYMPNNRTNPNGRVLRMRQDGTLETDINVSPQRFSFAVASPDQVWIALCRSSFGFVEVSTDTYTFVSITSASYRFPTWLPDSSGFFVSDVVSSNTVFRRFDAPSFASPTTFTPFSDNHQRNAIILNPAGTKIYCVGDIDVAVVDAVTGTQIGSLVPLSGGGNNVCFLPDGRKLYISTPTGLVAYDIATDTIGPNIAVGTNAQGMCVKTQ